jgi:hypothetical protein
VEWEWEENRRDTLLKIAGTKQFPEAWVTWCAVVGLLRLAQRKGEL